MENIDSTNSISNTLPSLLEELLQLRDSVKQNAVQRLAEFEQFYPAGQFSESAVNISHYLAFRRLDLRPLQERLAQIGLSSLGRGESHTMLNIESVIRMLGKANDIPLLGLETCADESFGKGREILEQNTSKLFGIAGQPRKVRIMVTFPSEAASNYPLVRNLLEKGMNCARINCAHDSSETWEQMIDNLEALRILDNILLRMQAHHQKKMAQLRALHW